MADSKFNLASFLSGLNPKMTSDVIRGAQFFTDTSGMEKYLKTRSKTEKTLMDRLKNMKTDEIIAAEQKAAFDTVRNISNQAIQSAPNVASAFTSGLGSAMGGLSSFAGSNIGALGSLANAGLSAEAPSMVAANDIRNIGLAGITQAALQEQLGVQSAKTARETSRTSIEDMIAQMDDTRREGLATLRGDRRANLLKYISALVGLAPNASGSGSSGTSGTDGTNGTGDQVNVTDPKELENFIKTGTSNQYLDMPGGGKLRPGYYGGTRPAPGRR
jgi:hypothetical protein